MRIDESYLWRQGTNCSARKRVSLNRHGKDGHDVSARGALRGRVLTAAINYVTSDGDDFGHGVNSQILRSKTNADRDRR